MNDVDTDVSSGTDTEADTHVVDSGGDSEGAGTEIQHEKSDEPGTDPTAQNAQKPYTPFATGKEKFKVDGQEFEWDWEETRRYAQLGRSGQAAMAKAAELEKKAASTYQQILKAAREDPEGLLAVLNPSYKPRSKSDPNEGDGLDTQVDPRDLKIKELEAKVGKFESFLEQQDVERARQEIENEFAEAEKKFPSIKSPIHKEYIRSQYRKYLNQGVTNISIEDLAFQLDQQVKEEQQAQMKAKRERLEAQRKNAPVPSVPGSDQVSDRRAEESGIEYAKRLAGRM